MLYINSLNDYYDNIDKSQKITTTTKNKFYLYNKILIYKVNNIPFNYKFYEPYINNTTQQIKNHKTQPTKYDFKKMLEAITII